jgi:lysozyme family protein
MRKLKGLLASNRFEGYNGFGYHHHGVPSPYLFGGSTIYGPPEDGSGKYVSDGKFDSHTVDTQLGTLTLLKRLVHCNKSLFDRNEHS